MREHEDRSSLESGLALDHGREVVATTPLDAEADVILKMPGDTLLPLLLALALVAVLTALLAHLWWVAVACGVLSGAFILLWLWPRPSLGQTAEPRHV